MSLIEGLPGLTVMERIDVHYRECLLWRFHSNHWTSGLNDHHVTPEVQHCFIFSHFLLRGCCGPALVSMVCVCVAHVHDLYSVASCAVTVYS